MNNIRPLSSISDEVAAEKGRLLAAQALMRDPERRKFLEETFGEAYCKNRYPEVYAPPSRFARILDRLKFVGR